VQHFQFFAALLAASAVFALLEIEIEGNHGWAASLPTWRIENRWTRALLGARAITGYHVYFHMLVLILTHLPFALGFVSFSWAAEFRILSFVILFWLIEDFLWFVFNPGWGLRGFRRDRIPWHAPNWCLFMPRDYWVFGPIGIALYLLSQRM
jgi:hypothetical protein